MINWLIELTASEAQIGERGRKVVQGMVIQTSHYIKVGEGYW